MTAIARRLLFFAVLLPVAMALPATAFAQSPAPDFTVRGGHFFTQALPGRTDGAGFAVQDGHGAKLWSALSERGGVLELGYPISRRFEWDGRVSQAFQWGILRWIGEENRAELVSQDGLPGGKLPDYAVQPDQPPIVTAEAANQPWSGWWWPAAPGIGPTLFAPGGPLEKYDAFVEAVTGVNPGTAAWERQEIFFPGFSWAGHCNGWAAAALLEPEPTEPREVEGITFSVGDLKGLLSSYHFADAAAWSHGQEGDLNPADFHRRLLTWIAAEKKGFVVTYEMGDEEVWSYPAHRFHTEWGPDDFVPNRWWVTTTVWMADNEVPPDFVGFRPIGGDGGKIFTYYVDGDPRNPTGGAWTGASESGRFAHPGRIWYPEPRLRNLDRQLASPNLERSFIGKILAGG